MPIFYRKAIEAAVHPERVGWLEESHLSDWQGLAKALDRLSPEMRCDAIYADWLLRLNENRTLILPIRDLLIGQGAMAANYLAELAQNADDASDGQTAEIRIRLDGDWLWVANNGRKVTSLNLLGLSRFFIHSAGKVMELNERTIGKFGIGFKSCYRIASEVFVFTWDPKDSYGFRLPVCREGDAPSVPDSDKLESLLSRLAAAGADRLDDEVKAIRCLGYCTPEFLDHLPAHLDSTAQELKGSSRRGTLFAFRIRPAREKEVRSRLSGQEHEIYELCPLFLPNLRLVELGPTQLKIQVGRRDASYDLPGKVQADKVTLVTSQPGTPQSHSRFWKLSGISDGDLWELALHADGQHRLRVEREDDERGTTVKDGSAYAYFPLNAVNWPFRFHLQLRLSPNLARDNWNPDERAHVLDQIERAVSGMGHWLEVNADKWHPNWRIESLIVRRPNANEDWAWAVWERMRKEIFERRLLRTVWGHPVSGQEARTVDLVSGSEARDHWTAFCGLLLGVEGEYPIVNAANLGDFEFQKMPDGSLRNFFLQVIPNIQDDVGRQALVKALFSIESAEPETLERVASEITIPNSNGTEGSLKRLMEQPSGADLPDAWHSVFLSLKNALWTPSHGLTAVFDAQLRFQMKKLSERVFNPSWESLPVVMGDETAWKEHGKEFWNLVRSECPAGCRSTVVRSLRIKSGIQDWLPIDQVWLVDSSSVNCFHGSVVTWDRGAAPNHDGQRLIREKLQAWRLWTDYEDAVEKRLEEALPTAIHDAIRKGLAIPPGLHVLVQAFEAVLQGSHAATLNRLTARWKALVQQAEKKASQKIWMSEKARLTSLALVSSDVENQLAGFIEATGLYQKAPKWLTTFAFDCLREAVGTPFLDSVRKISAADFNANAGRDLAESLLKEFSSWKDKQFTPDQLRAFSKLCEGTSKMNRQNWSVGVKPRTVVLLRDLLNPIGLPQGETQLASDRRDDASMNLALLGSDAVKWLGADLLPELLRSVPAVAEASVHARQLRVEIHAASAPLPAIPDDVQPETMQDSLFQSVLKNCEGRLARCKAPLSLRWKNGETVVAEIRDAAFAVMDGQLVTTKAHGASDNRQYIEVLSIYSRSARSGQNEAFEQAWKLGEEAPEDLYAKHRKAVMTTLLKTQVTDQGYREHHVIRELLQNAESAYDSKPGILPDERGFEFLMRPPEDAGSWECVASHCGRHFNEPVWDRRSNHQQERDDIRLIVSTPSSEAPPTEGWAGRFNRGFKSIFTVADTVQVESGPYRFAIQDMLLLNPFPPQASPEGFTEHTRFSFRCPKTKALKLLHLNSIEGQQRALSVFNASSFVFLQRVNHIHIQADRNAWQWDLRSSPEGSDWESLQVNQSFPEKKERFLVRRGRLEGDGSKRFGVAIRVDSDALGNLPVMLSDGWHKLRLTFESEDEFPLDFIVNGDFETDSGRLGIRNSLENKRLLAECLRMVGELCMRDLEVNCDSQRWLAWADILHLPKAEEELSQRYENHAHLTEQWEAISAFLCRNIPHEGEAEAIENLQIPTSLVRRLESFVVKWGFPTRSWIPKEMESRLPRKIREGHRKQSLDSLLDSLPPDIKDSIRLDFNRPEFLTATDRLSGPEKDELERARRSLQPTLPDTAITLDEGAEPWSVAMLWEFWEKEGKPVDDYTLTGANWNLLFADDDRLDSNRADRLTDLLKSPSSKTGQSVWYRLFGLACLMSAGRRMSELRSFWQTELDGSQFWERTSRANAFSEGTDKLFAEVTTRPFNTLTASGENAYFWRRVFYDIRKIHRLVWEDDFPKTILELVETGRGAELLNFLKTGYLPGQKAWVGVFGQSAGAPLFFVVRELCRLGIVADPEVRRLAFFVSTPVRRAMERIRWLSANVGNRVDFESLSALSVSLHRKIAADSTFGPLLLPYYDIPLLHLGLKG